MYSRDTGRGNSREGGGPWCRCRPAPPSGTTDAPSGPAPAHKARREASRPNAGAQGSCISTCTTGGAGSATHLELGGAGDLDPAFRHRVGVREVCRDHVRLAGPQRVRLPLAQPRDACGRARLVGPGAVVRAGGWGPPARGLHGPSRHATMRTKTRTGMPPAWWSLSSRSAASRSRRCSLCSLFDRGASGAPAWPAPPLAPRPALLPASPPSSAASSAMSRAVRIRMRMLLPSPPAPPSTSPSGPAGVSD